ncbi:MAG: methionyl-tRNA formyltransferase [Candidatus Binataceae bacterium]
MAGPQPPYVSERPRQALNIVFMGTPAFAARILERLIEASGTDFRIAGVVTRPDRPRRRGLKLESSEVAATATQHGLRIIKPVKIKTPAFTVELETLQPDLLVVAAYGRILPPAVLATPRLMPLNVHASILPRHRGAAPIEGALLAGDPVSGVTIMRIVEQLDAGPILLQREISLTSDETQASLKERLAELGAVALLEAIARLQKRDLPETPQDESAATYTKIVTKEDAVIDWCADATTIERMTRAYDPWPVARTTLAGEALMLYRARVADDEVPARDAEPGTVVRLKPEVVLKCGRGMLAPIEVQAAGRRRMAAADFFRGRRLKIGARLGG